jgi:DNA-binding CsgD family transcriptional regulator
MDRNQLRPVERVVLRMRDEGLSNDDIARRIRRSPQHVERIVAWTTWPRSGAKVHGKGLNPLERRVLTLRAEGVDHEELASRFRRSATHMRRVEGMAHLRLGYGLISG